MVSAAFHPAVEGAPIREVEVRQPRLPLGAKEGGSDRVGLTVVLRHRGHPLVAVLDLEGLLVPRPEVAVVAVASSCAPAAQQCNNVAEVRRETASALTVAKMAVVNSRFLLAHFRGR